MITHETLYGRFMIDLGALQSLRAVDEHGSVVAAADAAGELAWGMPLPEQLRASLNSRVADISNMGDRFGGMMTAATFLREFVDAGRSEGDAAARTPWAHLDIAGPSFNESAAYGYTPQDATGVMVRTLLGLIEGRAR